MKKRREQWIACLGMAVGGFFSVWSAGVYQPVANNTVSIAVEMTAELYEAKKETVAITEATVTEAETVSEVLEELEEDTPDQLILAERFAEGADTSDKKQSYGWQICETLEEVQSSWYQSLYQVFMQSPAQIAGMTGKSQESYQGKWNPMDDTQSAEDSETWEIRTWQSQMMSFRSLGGIEKTEDLSIKQIVAMANVVGFYQGWDTLDAYIDYAIELWENSHSYSAHMSDIYYCDGACLGNQEKMENESGSAESEVVVSGEDVQTEELIEETLAEESTVFLTNAEQGSEFEESASSDSTAQSEVSVLEVLNEVEGPALHLETVEVLVETEEETAENGPAMAAEIAETMQDTQEGTLNGEIQAENQEGIKVLSEAQSGANETLETSEEVSVLSVECPGHLDFYVDVTILDLDEENGLFACDSQIHPANETWSGWTNETREYVNSLCGQDWEEMYQLEDTNLLLTVPGGFVSQASIQEYIQQLPEEISEVRREIVSFALSSTGRVPYYWGGKPNRRNYEGNQFGSFLSVPDVDGRRLKGLDCSGWIQWVYWSVTGTRLPYESTSGLAQYGTEVEMNDLKPGDILVRTGENAHVILFLGWTDSGNILCVHETSGNVNNVTVTEARLDTWDTCRNILGE